LRLFTFCGFAASVYGLFADFNFFFILATLICLGSFLWAIGRQADLEASLRLNEILVAINQNELALLRGKPNIFSDGSVFRSPEAYFNDLDIFGPGSLFHLLNRAGSFHGKRMLASRLASQRHSVLEIREIQEAVKQLSREPAASQELMAAALVHETGDDKMSGILSWIKEEAKMGSLGWLELVRWGLPVLNLASLVYLLDSGRYWPLVLGIILNRLLLRKFREYTSAQHGLVTGKTNLLKQYAGILQGTAAMTPGDSALLDRLVSTAAIAGTAFRRLRRISSFFDQRLNMAVNIFLNSLVLYEIHGVLALEKWKRLHAEAFGAWVDAVGQIESLNSLACFAYNHPGYAYPSFLEKSLRIEARAMGHPLIPDAERISNGFNVGAPDCFQLITGSNMSGKTTFLRTVGVNMVLAQAGAPVAAAEFRCSPLQILSSLRIDDSLQEHTSYFLAELKKLQWIIGQLDTGRPSLVLIDEILRGTNSEDKNQGSEQFIRKLLSYPCLAVFATHDLALGKLEKEFTDRLRNYCFESRIQDGQLQFDYLIQPGIAKNKNASFLMKKMGIL
jgi:DNA mismatch repair ATPase MutS